MDPKYPYDLYDDDDYIVERKMSTLRREMYSHILIGAGFGVMLTVAVSGAIVWLFG